MPRTSDKRERLIEAADRLIHRHGFNKTTLADIADESNVPLGNVYYYFKTKDEICNAVIEHRKELLTGKLNSCCKAKDPKQALTKFVKGMLGVSKDIADTGCPHGKLCAELNSEFTELADRADGCMQVFLDWSRDQFKALGYKNPDKMSFEFISRIQGIVLLGHAMHDEKSIRVHLKSICDWIESLDDVNMDVKASAAA